VRECCVGGKTVRLHGDAVTCPTLLSPHSLVVPLSIERWCGVPFVMESWALLDDIKWRIGITVRCQLDYRTVCATSTQFRDPMIDPRNLFLALETRRHLLELLFMYVTPPTDSEECKTANQANQLLLLIGAV